jgi:hypothetical protein
MLNTLPRMLLLNVAHIRSVLDTWQMKVATLNANEFQLLTLRVASSLTAKQPRT